MSKQDPPKLEDSNENNEGSLIDIQENENDKLSDETIFQDGQVLMDDDYDEEIYADTNETPTANKSVKSKNKEKF